MKVNLILRAVDSIYWETKVPKGANIGQSLKEQGYPSLASCPKDHFEPDLRKLTGKQLDLFSELISSLDSSQTRILAWMLISQDTLSRFDLKIGQTVYVNLSAPYSEYLDNYFSGVIVKAGPKYEDIQYVYISSSIKKSSQSLLLVPITSVVTEDKFEKVKLKLTRKGKLKNPKPVVKNFKPTKENPVLQEIVQFLDSAKPVSELKVKSKNRNKGKNGNMYEV